MESAVVFMGGAPPHPGVVARLPLPRWVVAADSGLDHAFALGVHVDLLVGDLDSVSADGLERAHALAVPVERHRPDKDATDAELAIEAAVRRGARHLVVVSGSGERLDHSLGALLALARPDLAPVEVEAWWDDTHVLPVHGPGRRDLHAHRGDLVSLLPVHGPAHGITTTGLRYPLHGESLAAGSSRGVSNVFVDPHASVELASGTLLVLRPTALGGDRS